MVSCYFCYVVLLLTYVLVDMMQYVIAVYFENTKIAFFIIIEYVYALGWICLLFLTVYGFVSKLRVTGICVINIIVLVMSYMIFVKKESFSPYILM